MLDTQEALHRFLQSADVINKLVQDTYDMQDEEIGDEEVVNKFLQLCLIDLAARVMLMFAEGTFRVWFDDNGDVKADIPAMPTIQSDIVIEALSIYMKIIESGEAS